MKVLALDVGEKRIGLAMSDELGTIASPAGFVERRIATTKIEKMVRDENIERIVIGVPYLASGHLGSQASDVWKFAEELKELVLTDIEYENELLTSFEAKERLKGRKKKEKGDIDSMAATVILEAYLKRRK